MIFGCDKDTEPNPIECEISYRISSLSFDIGEHLVVSDFQIKPISPSNGVDIKKVEFFLGNKKIGSCLYPPYELDYEIPELPEGEHLFQIDVQLVANGYDDTTVWIRRNITINNPQTTE